MHAPCTRVQRRPVHGVLLFDKPLGFSSNDALQKAKWLLRAEKAGHTGTLDPLASGVLPLCFGAATKFSQMQLDAAKTYRATVRLGVRTVTGDAEGEVVQERPVDMAEVERLLPQVVRRFTGPILQVPPMHSALKRDGKPLYEYARQGIEVERVARAVEIHALNAALAVDPQGLPAIELVVTCSKGTYIRTLGEDIGEALGCGGHLTLLRRTHTGHYGLDRAVTLQAFEAMDEAARSACLLPVDSLLPDHDRVTLAGDDVSRFLSGVRRRGGWVDAAQVAVFGDEGRGLLGTARASGGELIPGRLLSPIEIQQIQESTPHAANTAQGIEEANV
ncbi:tRNA pseudouridine(55) synthase TruB [Xylophilus ampelinus]|uniref:tRNA pseudouridine synthase B n=1 Tax=Xylophilus ampelinus TaxID=54067 RepID=A0A318SQ36_9BURK|nr:tRNA pseudouridine(55) synthase TruB [Xylophilus ampelinus]MCS4511603.1 tRNA pseudouridine(55) synthase TruB [Xylophilus ampelinus]PYE74225.1 tRNA pseudouridine synthase B [Xylophilus ampelinus]